MVIAYIEAGSLSASLADRVVTGLLLPFGEVGRTNLGRFTIAGPGIITIPDDVSVLQANLEHDQYEPVARFLTTTETSAGIVASFQIGRNPEETHCSQKSSKAPKQVDSNHYQRR